jgi:hypothetical protein
LAGSSYLYTLAQLALAFVAFSTIVVIIRHMFSAGMSEIHIMIVRLFIVDGLSVSAFALLPPLLELFGLNESIIWRMSSGIVSIYSIMHLSSYVIHRRKLNVGSLPIRIYVNTIVILILNIFLWLNVIGKPFEPNIAPYALFLTWMLAMAGIIFIQTLDLFLEKPGQKQNS